MPISMKARATRLVVFGYNVATEKIVWTRDPDKQHFVGDPLDLTGTIITGYYKDGTQSDITDLCSYNPEEGNILTDGGELDLTASYTDRAGRVFDYDTTIRVGAIEFIRFTQIFNEQYYVGDVPNMSQLRVEAVWTDLSGETSEDGRSTTSNILKVEDITRFCTFTLNNESPKAFTEGGVNSVEAHYRSEKLRYFFAYECVAVFHRAHKGRGLFRFSDSEADGRADPSSRRGSGVRKAAAADTAPTRRVPRTARRGPIPISTTFAVF